jgi:hypothetical protein
MAGAPVPLYPPLRPLRPNLGPVVRQAMGATSAPLVLDEYYAAYTPPELRGNLSAPQTLFYDALRTPATTAQLQALAGALWPAGRQDTRQKRTTALLALLQVPQQGVPASIRDGRGKHRKTASLPHQSLPPPLSSKDQG